MKHLSSLAALAARMFAPLAGMAPAAAVAQVQTYYHAGAWDAFSGRSDTGGAVCGIGNTGPADSRRLTLRFDIGGADTVVSASKPDWSIPDNTQVRVVMQVGLNTPWSEVATGSGHTIDWRLDPAAAQTFDRQFRGASSMTVTFPDGNEPPWTLPLAGSTVISDTFARCIRDLTRQVQGSPPPNAAPEPPGSTQPFSATPAAPAR